MYIIIDPNNFSREQNYQDGVDLCKEFLTLNGLPIPEFRLGTPFKAGPGAYGFYRPGRVHVAVDRTRLPTKGEPIRAWSYTGWKSDKTAAGVTAHEVGHHVDHCLGYPSNKIGICTKGLELTSYAPNPSEVWAEAMRLFILNPELLLLGKPRAYRWIIENGLKPIVCERWDMIIRHAHPRYHQVGKKWIEKARA
jgi:hypothetical protein